MSFTERQFTERKLLEADQINDFSQIPDYRLSLEKMSTLNVQSTQKLIPEEKGKNSRASQRENDQFMQKIIGQICKSICIFNMKPGKIFDVHSREFIRTEILATLLTLVLADGKNI